MVVITPAQDSIVQENIFWAIDKVLLKFVLIGIEKSEDLSEEGKNIFMAEITKELNKRKDLFPYLLTCKYK